MRLTFYFCENKLKKRKAQKIIFSLSYVENQIDVSSNYKEQFSNNRKLKIH